MTARSLRRNVTILATLLCLPFAIACGSDDSTGPDVNDVAGVYDATALVVTLAGTPHDILADGGSIHLVLNASGTAAGHLTIPASELTSGEAVDEDMAGSWTLNGTTVTLTQSADTFVRDLPLTVGDGTLTGDRTFGGAQLHLVMSRQ